MLRAGVSTRICWCGTTACTANKGSGWLPSRASDWKMGVEPGNGVAGASIQRVVDPVGRYDHREQAPQILQRVEFGRAKGQPRNGDVGVLSGGEHPLGMVRRA